MESLIGQSLGKYEIRREVGRGGMATIYLAYQSDMDREVAIKVLPREFLHDATFLKRFRQEARSIARLVHPHILPVLDYGEDRGWTYIAMVYLPGGSLADRILREGNRIPLSEVARIVGQIADALDFAHREGIIHRDLKPANVLLDQGGNVYLSDFGIAKVTESTATLTGTGIVGTPAYMAPEMSSPGELSRAVDVYALGVILYQLVTGQLPYNADTPIGVMMAHAVQPVPNARLLRPDLPSEVQAVITRAMSKDPADRYTSALDLSASLEAALSAAHSADLAITTPMPVDASPSTELVSRSVTPLPPPASRVEGGMDQVPASAPAVAAAPPVGAAARRRSSGGTLLWVGLGGAALICLVLAVLAGGLGLWRLASGPGSQESPGGTTQSAETTGEAPLQADAGETARAEEEAAARSDSLTATQAQQISATGEAERTATAQAEAVLAEATGTGQALRDAAAVIPDDWVQVAYESFDVENDEWLLGSDNAEWGSRVASVTSDGTYRWEMTGRQTGDWRQGWELNPGSEMPPLGELANFYVSLDIRMTSTASDDYCGVKFRIVDDENFYYYLIGSGGKYLNGGVYLGNIYRDSILSSGAIVQGSSNKLGLLVRGSNFTFYVNGQQLDAQTHDDFVRGELTLMCINTSSNQNTVQFDNFLVFADPDS